MRILFLLTQDLESPSGLGRYLPLAKELTRLGHQMQIVALSSRFKELNHYHQIMDGVEVSYVAPMHVKKQGNEKSYYSNFGLIKVIFEATLKLSLESLSSKVDIIHVAKPHPMNSMAGLLSKYIKKKQFFLDCDDYEAASGQFKAKWQQMGVSWFERVIPHHAKIITTNTLFMKNKLISWGIDPVKIFYLPNGVDRKRFSFTDPIKLKDLSDSLKIENKKVILYLGSLSLPSHPVNLLLKAFSKIKIQMPESYLLIVGGGEDYNNLKSLADNLGISDSVLFLGRVPPECIPLYYRLADVSVDPVYDNDAARGRSPLKMFESWACGTPFVTADVGDRAELMGSPPAGILTQAGDPEYLAQAIMQVLDRPNLAEEISDRGFERVNSYYWDIIAKTMNGIYTQNNST